MLLVMASAVQTSFMYLAVGLGAIILAYAIVRSASFAYFRTKLEYLRSVLKQLDGGRNGEE